jgi:hypothetical protein
MASVQPGDRIVLNVQLTTEDVGRVARDANFLDSKRNWVVLAGCLVVGLVLLFDGLPSVGIVLLIATPLTALMLASSTFQGRRMMKMAPTIGEMKVWTFTSDAIESTGASQTSTFNWATFGSMNERSAYIYLRAKSGSQRIVIPLRAFGSQSEADQFKQFVRRHLIT